MIFAPWLRHQIRLADRQGLLQGGRDMSAVQAFASELLMVHEDIAHAEDFEWDFKSRLAGGNPELIQFYFGEHEDKKMYEDEADEVVQKGEWSRVEWKSPAETGIDEYNALMAEVAALSSLTVDPSDKEAGWI